MILRASGPGLSTNMPRALEVYSGLNTASPYSSTAAKAWSTSSVMLVGGMGMPAAWSVMVQDSRSRTRRMRRGSESTGRPRSDRKRRISRRSSRSGE